MDGLIGRNEGLVKGDSGFGFSTEDEGRRWGGKECWECDEGTRDVGLLGGRRGVNQDDTHVNAAGDVEVDVGRDGGEANEGVGFLDESLEVRKERGPGGRDSRWVGSGQGHSDVETIDRVLG